MTSTPDNRPAQGKAQSLLQRVHLLLYGGADVKADSMLADEIKALFATHQDSVGAHTTPVEEAFVHMAKARSSPAHPQGQAQGVPEWMQFAALAVGHAIHENDTFTFYPSVFDRVVAAIARHAPQPTATTGTESAGELRELCNLLGGLVEEMEVWVMRSGSSIGKARLSSARKMRDHLMARTLSAQPAKSAAPAGEATDGAWKPMADFDNTEMQFVLATDGDVVRLKLWNPYQKHWENQPEDSPTYTHWMKLPSLSAMRATQQCAGEGKT